METDSGVCALCGRCAARPDTSGFFQGLNNIRINGTIKKGGYYDGRNYTEGEKSNGNIQDKGKRRRIAGNSRGRMGRLGIT